MEAGQSECMAQQGSAEGKIKEFSLGQPPQRIRNAVPDFETAAARRTFSSAALQPFQPSHVFGGGRQLVARARKMVGRSGGPYVGA